MPCARPLELVSATRRVVPKGPFMLVRVATLLGAALPQAARRGPTVRMLSCSSGAVSCRGFRRQPAHLRSSRSAVFGPVRHSPIRSRRRSPNWVGPAEWALDPPAVQVAEAADPLIAAVMLHRHSQDPDVHRDGSLKCARPHPARLLLLVFSGAGWHDRAQWWPFGCLQQR
jgi:hypothetical protein